MRFEWDSGKAARNLRKHGVSFEEGQTVLEIGLSITTTDVEHSTSEERELTIGLSDRSRVLVVWHTAPKRGVIRIIGTRKATRQEGSNYVEELQQRQRQ